MLLLNFAATMINHITWDINISEPFLEVDVKLNLFLEVVILLASKIMIVTWIFNFNSAP